MRYSVVTNRVRSIVLIGMMGAGKSAVGSCLQRQTNLPLLDTDEIVASNFGISISEIFSRYGETTFREAEADALRQISPEQQAIIVTGGGIVLRQGNLDILRQHGVVVWLHGDAETLFQRASRSGNRPLLTGKNPNQAFARLLKTRLPLYAKTAHLRVDTSMLTDEEVAVAILSKVKRFNLSSRLASSITATA